jgi:hypothetical protein
MKLASELASITIPMKEHVLCAMLIICDGSSTIAELMQ